MSTTQKFWFVLIGAILGMVIIACSCGSILPTLTSTPTPTEAPTAANPSVSSPTLGYDSLPYSDDFSNPDSGWGVSSNDTGSAGYQDGTYFVISKAKQVTFYGTPGKFFGDTVIDVDATPIRGPADNNFYYDVSCRRQTNGDGYVFKISADGSFGAGYYTGGGHTYTSLLTGDQWQASSAIRQGLATNHFTVTCAGSQLKVEVNGVVLYQGQDATFKEGDLSLETSTNDDNNTPAEVHFDNLAVTAP